jgi:KDO2-lipid IV(A) lauroyltransferase
MDRLALFGLRVVCGLLRLLPPRVGEAFVAAVLRIFLCVVPRYGDIARRNLELAFPEASESWRAARFAESVRSLARVLVDFARLPRLDRGWVERHVDVPFLTRFKEIKRAHPGRGVVIATGHLGSFELLAHSIALLGHPLSFVVRNFTLPRVDAWWTASREASGNRVIGRRGAFKDIVRDLQTGRDVAVLFDQNVTRNHAVFVPWFGIPAATTRAVALAALRTESPVVVAGVGYRGDDRYEVLAEECNFSALYAATDISTEEKVLRMTADMAGRYVEMIRRYPGEWFWMHRRWKTRPEGEAEDVYRSRSARGG